MTPISKTHGNYKQQTTTETHTNKNNESEHTI